MVAMLQVKVAEERADEVAAAILSVVPNAEVVRWAQYKAPKPASTVDEKLAVQCADAVMPSPKAEFRRDALKLIFCSMGTCSFQEGESDPTLRNATGALSKSLRSVFPFYASPIDQLVIRKKTYFENGVYEGTEYYPTQLGKRVREILKERGVI